MTNNNNNQNDFITEATNTIEELKATLDSCLKRIEEIEKMFENF